MNLIDETYFAYEPCLIHGLESRSNGYSGELTDGRVNAVLRAISRFEPVYLIALLGSEAYSEYKETESNAKWDALKAVLRNEKTKRSPIANFVFHAYQMENQVQRGDTGDYIPKADNMQNVSPAHKMAVAWNDMVQQNEVICQWIYDNIITAETPLVDFESEIDVTGWISEGLLTYKSPIEYFV